MGVSLRHFIFFGALRPGLQRQNGKVMSFLSCFGYIKVKGEEILKSIVVLFSLSLFPPSHPSSFQFTMRSVLALTSLLAVASAAATAQKSADYAKHKVIRVKQTAEIDQWIKQFSLPTWIKQGGNIDVVVPPSVSVLDGVKSTVMHADLGESIKQESSFQVYAGE